ncbi:hypothetical protein RGU72_13025 [Undibacterium sp. 5I1]|uniref:hypothetical protein n=1 Tax=unclassified Undibacterium TaxID=2630295 RepID=UPI002AB411B4|nr:MULTISPECIES: hypothetical protein [unclassified Undibacterium]MDY7539176.1 hypothetical protein [Undibacterium sp. 5I1]MEB0232396.1 hypothetical protein [Undibacterium sp. 10I3]MEB0257026.1 hypothetical protein [Undibacterium sp. 5I1]
MNTKTHEIYMIGCAISGIKTIRDTAEQLQTPLDNMTRQGSMGFWASVGEALSEEMSGEALGLMMGILVDVAQKGHLISDIIDIELVSQGNSLALKIIVQDKDGTATTLH